jgi:hypothetical protein
MEILPTVINLVETIPVTPFKEMVDPTDTEFELAFTVTDPAVNVEPTTKLVAVFTPLVFAFVDLKLEIVEIPELLQLVNCMLLAVMIPLALIFSDLRSAIVEIPELTKSPEKDCAVIIPAADKPFGIVPTILVTNCTFV